MLSTEEYRAVFEASPDGTLVVDEEGIVRDLNPEAERLFGWSRDELIGEPIETLVPESLRGGHVGHRSRYVENPHNRPMGAGLDLLGQRKDGSHVPVEISLSPWTDSEGVRRIICSVRDITIRKRLQSFSEGALRATEEERQRIARELHDDTAQRIATLILRVRVLAEEPDASRRAEFLRVVRDELVEATEGVKRIARGLRPPELEEVGLAAALHAHFRNLQEGTEFRIHASLEHIGNELTLTQSLALYRIVQEALSNVRRHSGIMEAHVTLRVEPGYVVTEVWDEGNGFATSGLDQDGRGLGLVGMHERAAMIGAGISIDSKPGEGTHVRVAVPISGDDG